jgi:hypothetical protein
MSLGPGVDFALIGPLFFIFGWIVSFAIGLLFVVLAARFATRAVLDEIRKDRARTRSSG